MSRCTKKHFAVCSICGTRLIKKKWKPLEKWNAWKFIIFCKKCDKEIDI